MNEKHNCEVNPIDIKTGDYGIAIDWCYEGVDDELWVGNGEYSNQVNFCPFCGYKAKVNIKHKEDKQ